MTSPRPECTSTQLKKRQVWPNGDISGTATGSAGKVTEQPSLQSAQGQISSLSWKILVGRSSATSAPPGAGMSHER
jgi:hypothetical protein